MDARKAETQPCKRLSSVRLRELLACIHPKSFAYFRLDDEANQTTVRGDGPRALLYSRREFRSNLDTCLDPRSNGRKSRRILIPWATEEEVRTGKYRSQESHQDTVAEAFAKEKKLLVEKANLFPACIVKDVSWPSFREPSYKTWSLTFSSTPQTVVNPFLGAGLKELLLSLLEVPVSQPTETPN